MQSERVSQIIARHERMRTDKMPWNSTFQLIGEYVFYRRQDFLRQLMPGQFLTSRIFDSSAPRALHLMAASINGALWPSTDKAFVLEPPSCMPEEDRNSQPVLEYYRRAKAEMVKAMDAPAAGFAVAREEHMLDNGAFGISGIAVMEGEDDKTPIKFMAVNTKMLTVSEGADGFIDTVYMEKEMTIRKVVQEYGMDVVSQPIRDAYVAGLFEQKVRVLHAIEPRHDMARGKYGAANMPVASIHIDLDNGTVLRESGYYEMPVFVVRFWKAMSELYGRSPAMECMPDILEVNAEVEMFIMACEKLANPPIAVTHDSAAGGGKIDTSAGGMSVRSISGRISEIQHRWIEPIMTVGDIKPLKERISEVRESIADSFFRDRLLDPNNEVRQTLGEFSVRNQQRGMTLATVYARQIAELYDPLIRRCFNILLTRGRLGYPANSVEAMRAQAAGENCLIIPDAVVRLMVAGEDCYEIRYISPAARIMQAEELQGIMQLISTLERLAPANPGVYDPVNMDKLIAKLVELTNTPEEVLQDLEVVKSVRQARAQMQQQQAGMEAQHMQAQTARGFGQAMHAAAQAGVPPLSLVPNAGAA